MRALLTMLFLAVAGPALADPCGDLADKVAAATGAKPANRTSDFVLFRIGDATSLTLSCAHPDPSSLGAQFKGGTPPDAYYDAFGRASQAVTGIAADVVVAAARRAHDAASRLRHSNVDAGGARVTCSVTKSETDPMTFCAIIERSDRS